MNMRINNTLTTYITLLVPVIFWACEDPVEGDGIIIGETRELADFRNISLFGSPPVQEIDIDGSADIDNFDILSEQVDVSISGSGNVQVTAIERLDVRIRGSGDVLYRGDPELTSSFSGSGRVLDAN